jgi:CMP-N-acetylneuraminic acid synthetase
VTVLAIVPARGGSKGIPRKNIVPLLGRPLIAYTLDAARAAKSVGDILVSTEDEEIASVCEQLGVSVAYRRPVALGGDRAGMAETVIDALDWWRMQNGEDPEIVVLLQPTSPLRAAEDIDGTVGALLAARASSAISVHEMREHPMECIRMTGAAWEMLVDPPKGAAGRQDYDARFHFINGAVYAVIPRFLREHKAFVATGNETALYVMNALRGIDIDDPEDLHLAEAILGHPALNSCAQK